MICPVSCLSFNPSSLICSLISLGYLCFSCSILGLGRYVRIGFSAFMQCTSNENASPAVEAMLMLYISTILVALPYTCSTQLVSWQTGLSVREVTKSEHMLELLIPMSIMILASWPFTTAFTAPWIDVVSLLDTVMFFTAS